MPNKKISVIGLGKLGAPLLATFAAKGFPVIGLDIYKPFVDAINAGRAPVVEPKLQECLDGGGKNVRATQDYGEVIRESDVTFLIVPTPSREDGHFSDEHLRTALRELGRELKASGKDYHTFVITSTVSPGTCEKSLIPLLEETSGRKLNKGFGVAYNPEFIALGEAINGFLNPDLVLIGESEKKVGDMLQEIYQQVVENKPVIARMSIISAEITKIALNAYITMKISYANTLAQICEKIPGADVDAITKALGADKRISPYYLIAGAPFAGPCFPRDSRAFAAFARKYGVDAKLARATDEINKVHISHMVEKVLENINPPTTPEFGAALLAGASPKTLSPHQRVAILGLAYKVNTPVIEESPAIAIIEQLLARGYQIVVYDPLAMENARRVFGENVLYASSAKEALSFASLAVVTTREKEFARLREEDITHTPTVIIDCWRMLSYLKQSPKVRYIGIGKYPRQKEEATNEVVIS